LHRRQLLPDGETPGREALFPKPRRIIKKRERKTVWQAGQRGHAGRIETAMGAVMKAATAAAAPTGTKRKAVSAIMVRMAPALAAPEGREEKAHRGRLEARDVA